MSRRVPARVPARAWVRWLWHFRAAVLLGFATIGSYGIVQYAIGVLIGPIADDTGWSVATVAGAYSVGVLLAGPAAVASGYVLDRAGSRPVLMTALLAGAALLAAASWSGDAVLFVVGWGLGAAAVGGGLYYPVTMAATNRLYPDRRPAALSVLTLLGALASPIFYPVAGALVDALGWRAAVRVLVLLMVACALPAAALVRSPAGTRGPERPAGPRRWRASARGVARLGAPAGWLLCVAALSAAGTSAMMLHQVPAMQAAGLSLAASSSLAGARGLMQIPGRLVLAPTVRLLGLRGSTATAYGLVAVGVAALGLALAVGGAVALSLVFVVTAGVAIGLLSPLHGLLAAETYGDARLGTLSGVQQLIGAATGAAGAWAAGALIDATGGYGWTLATIAALEVGAIAAL
ncbi:MAG: MFS transporter, partial [Chloroflexi bacterium]|nr:MFS transporter [Chloroflexota bacterium]